jgi:hypothetical protein
MKTKSLGLIAGVALLISMLSGGPASADTLPDYSWDTSHLCAGATQFCAGTNKVFPANTQASYSDQYGTTSVTASETFSSTSPPILSATATAATSNANANAEASLDFTYFIEFTGPSGVVPVTVNTNGTTTVGGPTPVWSSCLAQRLFILLPSAAAKPMCTMLTEVISYSPARPARVSLDPTQSISPKACSIGLG